MGSTEGSRPSDAMNASSKNHEHWIDSVDLKSISQKTKTPVFIYSEKRVEENVSRINQAVIDAGLGGRVALYVPFFPNSNPHILRALKEHGVGILLQIPEEFELITQHGFSDFIVSPGHIGNAEIEFWNRKPYWTFLGSVDEIAFAIENKAETLCLRIDALGSDKPGVKVEQLAELAEMLKTHNRTLDCFEVYCGSGNSLEQMVDICRQTLQIHLDHFPTTRAINFAGGHGFDYAGYDPQAKHFDWLTYLKEIESLGRAMGVGEDVRYLFEPARDVLADVGVLLAGVKRDMISHSVGNIVATDASRMLMPSAQMRDREHNIGFLDGNFKPIVGGETLPAMVRGRTILRNDYVLPRNYDVPTAVRAGDHILIYDVGAYCATQHMEFLNVPPPGEVLIAASGDALLVTKPGNPHDKWRNLLASPEVLVSSAEGSLIVGEEALA